MIQGADSSSYHPTLAQLQDAYQQGVRAWGKYLPGPGIYSGDTKADFDLIHQAGMKSIGWASGKADPAQQKALAASWGVDYPTLDDEEGIRAFGPWEQPWLDTSEFGLYMPYGTDGSRIKNFRAPWYIMAGYYGASPYTDPQATWKGTPPALPHGWQWAGTVQAYGGEVDRLWLDDWFAAAQPAQGELFTVSQYDDIMTKLQYVTDRLNAIQTGSAATPDDANSLAAVLTKLQYATDRLNAIQSGDKATPDDSASITAVLNKAGGGASGPLKLTLTGTAQP